MILGQLHRNHKQIEGFSNCFTDTRNQDWVEDDLEVMLIQRVFGITLGYEDLNDHEKLRLDPLIGTICGRDDVEGKKRRQSIDKGKPLAGKSTLNRLELSAERSTGLHKIQSDAESIEHFFINAFVKSLP